MNFYPCYGFSIEKKRGRPSVRNGLTTRLKSKLIMRINIVISLIILTCLHVSAKVNAQKFSITAKDAAIELVFEQIAQKSGYDFFYDARQIKAAKPVTLNLKDAELKAILDACFKEQPFSYSIQNKTIVVTTIPATSDKKSSNQASAAAVIIKGKVTDKQNMPLEGVSVRIKGSNTGTLTDKSGNYSIEAEPNGVIIFSYIGYQTFEIRINNQTEINMTMVENTSQLEEQVIKGYYTTTKELNTGNVSEVKAEAISRQPITDVLSALQGQIPGLFIQQNSGVGGREFTVRLRGQNSLANGNEPLYIVDGVPFNSTTLNTTRVTLGASSVSSPFAAINPADIESIQVLKDADATAIYGSRGANGVIIINTKRGKTGSTTVDVNVYTGSGNVTRMRPLLNTEEYLAIRREALKNDNATPGPSDYDLNGGFALNKYTDWQDLLIGNTAKINDAQLAFSGGSVFTRFRLAGGFHKEGTVYPGSFYTQRASGSASFSHVSENNRLKIDFAGIYSNNVSKLPGTDLARLIFLAPNAPDVYTETGALNFANNIWTNPLVSTIHRNSENSNNLNVNANLSFEIVKGLVVKSGLGFNSAKFEQSHIQPATSFNNVGFTPAQIAQARRHAFSTTNVRTYVLEPQISYSKEIKEGVLDALVGATYQETNNTRLSQSASGFATDEIMNNLFAAATVAITENPIVKYRYNAVYGRLGYTYQQKYVINLTGRRDGSSRFGPGNQFGNFGAIGAAWLFGKENFIKKNISFLSSGKLRASVGSTGNDKLEDYKYLSTYSTYAFTYQGNPSQIPSQLTNPYFAWERVNKLEVGMDIGFMEEQINLSASWYRNRTVNQLVGYSLSDVTGFKTVQANLPAVLQNSGLELEAGFHLASKTGFGWQTSVNLTVPRSKLVAFPNIVGSGTYANRYEVGMPLEIRKLYHYTGVDPTTKLYTFQDVNKDGTISSPQDLQVARVGQDYYGAWTNTFTYKRLQLDVLIIFARQMGAITPFNGFPGAYNGGTGNQPKSILNGTDYQQPYTQTFTGPIATQLLLFRSSDSQLADASYLRLRNISLSWKFAEKWKFMKLGRAFAQCQNLFTITDFKGLDPETSRNAYLDVVPPLRVVTLGLQFML